MSGNTFNQKLTVYSLKGRNLQFINPGKEIILLQSLVRIVQDSYISTMVNFKSVLQSLKLETISLEVFRI